jgi:hypothetical protein
MCSISGGHTAKYGFLGKINRTELNDLKILVV